MRAATIAAMPNAHSHAFQRDLRGLGERNPDDFWSWRTQMMHLAQALDPESMQRVATQVYGEMLAAGYGAVGEFHYVHHGPDGTPYEEPNALALAVAQAAIEVGLEIVLIPAAYHRGGHPRFHDPDVESFLARVDALREWAGGRDGVSVAVAAHSVRAVPPDWLEAIAGYASDHGLPRHVHASEQPREVRDCRAQHGASPIELLARTGFLGPRTSVVHAIHVDERDIALLADSETIVITCPTTEGNLGDGHLPALAYRDAGVRLAIGSDSQVRVDPFEETRELETGARREGTTRRALLAHHGDLWAELARNGLASLGLQGGADDRRRPRAPRPARRRQRRAGARAGDVRLGRRRRPSGQPRARRRRQLVVAVGQLGHRQDDDALARIAHPRATALGQRARRVGRRAGVELVERAVPQAAVVVDHAAHPQRGDALLKAPRRALGRRAVAEQRAEDRVGVGLAQPAEAQRAGAHGRLERAGVRAVEPMRSSASKSSKPTSIHPSHASSACPAAGTGYSGRRRR